MTASRYDYSTREIIDVRATLHSLREMTAKHVEDYTSRSGFLTIASKAVCKIE